MATYDFSAPRLYVDTALVAGASVPLDKGRQNYLCNVLRLSEGKAVLIFNGRDGEWQAWLTAAGRSKFELRCASMVRPQTTLPHLVYCFAPLKHARLDYMVQKAVEMGAGVLQPVLTRRTQAARVNIERMRANVVEAAEQCGILCLPEVRDPCPLSDVLANWSESRTLVFCDEDADPSDGEAARRALAARSGAPMGVLIGPEGGFAPEERAAILACGSAVRLWLGPRILRADTAAVAALAFVQATAGDWRR